MSNTTSVTSRSVEPVESIKFCLSRFAAAVASARRTRRTYRALSSLNDRALHDIGLTRTMVLSVSINGTRM